jgi:hypothetical protein
VIDNADHSCEELPAAIIVVDAGQAEQDLAAGRLRCPRCHGAPRAWSHAARRRVLEWLRRWGVDHAVLLDAEVLAHLDPQRTDLADALVALGAAVAAWRRCFARHAAAWTLIGVFTGGRLLGPTAAD